MIQYNLLKNGIVTNTWYSGSGRDENYYEPGFGKQDRWVRIGAEEFNIEDALDTREVVTLPAREEERNHLDEIIQEAMPAETITEYKLPREYDVQIIDVTAQLAQEAINIESLAYLASTDWYLIRQLETGIEMPEEIAQARQNARNAIVR